MLPGDETTRTRSRKYPNKGLLLSGVPVLILILVAAQAVPGGQGPTVTYTINLQDDGSAIWNMEYRTPILTPGDTASFQNFSEQIQSVSLPDYTELMRQSATDASIATARPVEVSGFSADAAIQSGPTGSYGVVHYRCRWSGFAQRDDLLTVGDVFVGGLYLGKDHALVIRPPPGFGVAGASPPPDGSQDGLVWYGIRSFGAGEPRVVLRRDPIPWFPVLLIVGIAGLAIGLYASRKRFLGVWPVSTAGAAAEKTDPGTSIELGDRILGLLRERGGSLFQSEVVEVLGLPKSTVSEAINRLHEGGRVEKVRKGRENLIRLTRDE
jgi:hypothetical protein